MTYLALFFAVTTFTVAVVSAISHFLDSEA
jgi:hypothetical protein